MYAWGKNREQLFDLRTDPGEMVNLAVSRRHGPLLAEMRQALHDWCRRTGDKFDVPGHEMLSPGAER